MKKDCKNTIKNLTAYLDGELNYKRSVSASEHLRQCSACQKELQDLKASMALLLEWQDITPSEDYDRMFWRKLNMLREQRASKRDLGSFLRAFLTRNFNMATSAGLAILLVCITFFQAKPYKNESAEALQMALNTDLLLNLKVIEFSEALEHFELIEVLDQLDLGS